MIAAKILVSILVPVYNRSEWIGQCLDCLLVQTYQNIEILIYDDGSTDDSASIIISYSEKDSRIRLIKGEKNKGVAEARTKLVQECRGTYVLFCDSDDIMDPRAVEKSVHVMECEKIDLLYFRFKLNKGEYCIPQFKHYLPNGRKYTRAELKKYYFKDPVNLFFSALWNKCYRAEILKKNNLKFQPEMEDVFFNIDYLRHINQCYVLPEYLYIYNQSNESITRKPDSSTTSSYQTHINRWETDKQILKKILITFGDKQDNIPDTLARYFYMRYIKQRRKVEKMGYSWPKDLENEEIILYIKQGKKFSWDLYIFMDRTKQTIKQTVNAGLKRAFKYKHYLKARFL